MNASGNSSGDEKPRCGAKNKQENPSGSPTCRKPAGWGTKHQGFGHCRLHGGNTESQTKAAQKEMLAESVGTFGLPIEIDAKQALTEELWRTAGHVAWLGNIVETIERDNLVWGMTKQVVGGKDHGKTFAAAPNMWLNLYREERKHLTLVTAAAIKAGIDERRVELEEQKASAISDAFFKTLDALDLTDEQTAKALDLWPRLLESIGREGN